ncbi:MAG: sulfatase-like hydrolase/transferase [Bacteroidota bacterium]
MFRYKPFFLSIGLILSCFHFSCNPSSTIAQKQSPNILIILADDMGYGDLGCYGGITRTPNIDALASRGIRFTHCYAGAPNCSPSRVSLMTGRIPARSGMYSYRPPKHVMHLPDEEITIAERLKAQGYQTAHMGKWHLGCLPQDPALKHPQPDQQGFDYSLGTENNAMPSHLNPVNFVRNGKEIGETDGYSCQLVADEVTSWFEQHYEASRPFFLYVPFHEPHAKIASPPELIAHYPDQTPKDAAYFANIENMDLATGRILTLLKEKGLDKNTMIFFASDNGSYRMGSNGELRGLKGGVYEGGMRIPGIFSFPGMFPEGKVSDLPIWFQDVLPTVCDLTGASVPKDRPIDGVPLLSYLKHGTAVQRTQPMLWFFYRSSPEIALRMGDYNLIARVNDTIPRTHWIADRDMPFIKQLQPDFFELYHLPNDPGQQQDLAASEPEKLAEMKAAFVKIFEEVREEGPFWEGLPAYDPKKANHNKHKEFLRNQDRFLNR